MAKKRYLLQGSTENPFAIMPTKQGKKVVEMNGNELPNIKTKLDADTLNDDLNDLQKGFAERAKKENERFEAVGSLDYYFCVYFNNPKYKWAILQKLGLEMLCDGEQYINGYELVTALNKCLKPEFQLDVPKDITPIPKPFSQNKRIQKMPISDII